MIVVVAGGIKTLPNKATTQPHKNFSTRCIPNGEISFNRSDDARALFCQDHFPIQNNNLSAAMDKNLRRLRLLQTQSGTAAAELRAAVDRLAQYETELAAAKQKATDAQSRRAGCEAAVTAAAANRDASLVGVCADALPQALSPGLAKQVGAAKAKRTVTASIAAASE